MASPQLRPKTRVLVPRDWSSESAALRLLSAERPEEIFPILLEEIVKLGFARALVLEVDFETGEIKPTASLNCDKAYLHRFRTSLWASENPVVSALQNLQPSNLDALHGFGDSWYAYPMIYRSASRCWEAERESPKPWRASRLLGCRFCRADTTGFSLAQREVRNLCRQALSQFSEAAGFISPVSKSTSSTKARAKPSFTISSRRIGKISSGRSAESRRSAADSLDQSRGTSTLVLGRSCGLAMGIYSGNHSSIFSTACAACWHASDASGRLDSNLLLLRRRRSQLRPGNQSHETHCVGVL